MSNRKYHISNRYAAYLLALLTLTYMVSMADRLMLGALLPAIQEEWKLSDLLAGWLNIIFQRRGLWRKKRKS